MSHKYYVYNSHLLILSLTCLCFAQCSSSIYRNANQNYPLGAEQLTLFQAHNEEREKRGKRPVVSSPLLTEAAQKHAEWMSIHGMSHREGRSTPGDRATAEDYNWSAIAENVAEGQPDVASVMKDWMGSPGHKTNILGDYQEIGIGIAVSGDTKFWVVMFGNAR